MIHIQAVGYGWLNLIFRNANMFHLWSRHLLLCMLWHAVGWYCIAICATRENVQTAIIQDSFPLLTALTWYVVWEKVLLMMDLTGFVCRPTWCNSLPPSDLSTWRQPTLLSLIRLHCTYLEPLQLDSLWAISISTSSLRLNFTSPSFFNRHFMLYAFPCQRLLNVIIVCNEFKGVLFPECNAVTGQSVFQSIWVSTNDTQL